MAAAYNVNGRFIVCFIIGVIGYFTNAKGYKDEN